MLPNITQFPGPQSPISPIGDPPSPTTPHAPYSSRPRGRQQPWIISYTTHGLHTCGDVIDPWALPATMGGVLTMAIDPPFRHNIQILILIYKRAPGEPRGGRDTAPCGVIGANICPYGPIWQSVALNLSIWPICPPPCGHNMCHMSSYGPTWTNLAEMAHAALCGHSICPYAIIWFHDYAASC